MPVLPASFSRMKQVLRSIKYELIPLHCFSFLLFFHCLIVPDQAIYGQEGTWANKDPFGIKAPPPSPIGVTFSVGNKGYFLPFGYDNRLWEYNAVSNTWSEKADFPGVGRSGAVAFVVGSKGYVATGVGGSTFLKDVWEYDTNTDTWTRKKDSPGGERFLASAFSIGDMGYLGM